MMHSVCKCPDVGDYNVEIVEMVKKFVTFGRVLYKPK
jgi:hypothetical protein